MPRNLRRPLPDSPSLAPPLFSGHGIAGSARSTPAPPLVPAFSSPPLFSGWGAGGGLHLASFGNPSSSAHTGFLGTHRVTWTLAFFFKGLFRRGPFLHTMAFFSVRSQYYIIVLESFLLQQSFLTLSGFTVADSQSPPSSNILQFQYYLQ